MSPATPSLVIFSSRGKIGLIDLDGANERYLSFDAPNQVNWQAGPPFGDGRRMIVTSYEEGKTWEGTVQTHLWVYDLGNGELNEIATRDRPAPFMVCAALLPGLLPGGQRMIAGPVVGGEQRVIAMNLDGSDQVEISRRGDGFAYGVELSPDASRVAYHLTGPGDLPYRIAVSSLDGVERTIVAHQPNRLFFGPRWSPDGEWLLFQGCLFKEDPGHDWSDLYLVRPDGSDFHAVTDDYRQWFGASYGSPATRGGGSEMPEWSPDGQTVTYTRAVPGSRTAWEFQPQRPDTDHFNRDYLPDLARGGTELCLLDPFTGATRVLTPHEPNVWNFRARWSPDGARLLFCRARIGEPSEIWVMNAEGSDARLLTRGYEAMGADHPRWWR